MSSMMKTKRWRQILISTLQQWAWRDQKLWTVLSNGWARRFHIVSAMVLWNAAVTVPIVQLIVAIAVVMSAGAGSCHMVTQPAHYRRFLTRSPRANSNLVISYWNQDHMSLSLVAGRIPRKHSIMPIRNQAATTQVLITPMLVCRNILHQVMHPIVTKASSNLVSNSSFQN